jgi:hypothetical protein
MNAYLRNGIITLVINVIIFIIGWGCIVPDQILDQTHLFGLIGDIQIVKGNTAVVFGVCACMSTLSMIVALVEAIVEDYSRPCRFNPVNPAARAEKPRKAPKIEATRMRITDPASSEKVVDPSPAKVDDQDPKTPIMD